MENPNGKRSNRKKRHCPELEYMPQLKMNETQVEAEDSDQDLTKTISEFKIMGVKIDLSEGKRLGLVIGNLEESFDWKKAVVPSKEGYSVGDDAQLKCHGAQLNVNLAILTTDSLRRYIKQFNIEGINSDSSREQILNAAQRHFASQPPLNEQQVIHEFIDAARRLKNKGKKPKD
ncbi:hypothetical protein REPUB_Repub02eG0281400 [Reevesia pubescens]